MVHICSFNDQILVIDPADGEVINEYPYTEALDAKFLEGEWIDDEEDPSVTLRVYDNLEFEVFLNANDGNAYYYEGRFNLDTLSEEYSPGPDWLRTDLVYTTDPVFDDADNIGDFIVNYSIRENVIGDAICLAQINNGDSFLSYNLGIFDIMLYRIAHPTIVQ